LSSDYKEGVLFSTYATLVSSVNKGACRSRTCHNTCVMLTNYAAVMSRVATTKPATIVACHLARHIVGHVSVV